MSHDERQGHEWLKLQCVNLFQRRYTENIQAIDHIT